MLQKYLPLYGNYFVLFQKNTDFFFFIGLGNSL